jgi:taurine dioxygenase
MWMAASLWREAPTLNQRGYAERESDRLLDALFPYIERIDYELEWRIGDYVIFDNRCSAHARTEFPADQLRLLKRGKVAGAPMIAAEA